jgi:hypothetical protein
VEVTLVDSGYFFFEIHEYEAITGFYDEDGEKINSEFGPEHKKTLLSVHEYGII